MRLANSERLGRSVSIPPSFATLVARLEDLSVGSRFAAQRELALERALRPYLSRSTEGIVTPLPQEVELARLFLFADFYPEDGQLTLVEQLRDVITEHISDDERQWLDPLKHSYMDLVEALPSAGDSTAVFRSWGDGRIYRVPLDQFGETVPVGQSLLTRLICRPDHSDQDAAVIAGSALVLPNEDARRLYDAVGEDRREMEFGGSFELGEWPEFAKRFGYMLLWAFADMRVASLADAVAGIRFVSADGQPYLYAIALYAHHEFGFLSKSLSDVSGFRRQTQADVKGPVTAASPPTWTMEISEASGQSRPVARLMLTVAELIVECESSERLNAVKHELAAAYGYRLHFRGEMIESPQKHVTLEQLSSDGPVAVRISREEEWARLKTFFETVYLDWADQESPALDGQTPRHAAASNTGRQRVAVLIDEMERQDLGLRRAGRRAFDYNTLRAHVGLDEVRHA